MKRTLIKNGKLINDEKIFESDILIENGVISKIDTSITINHPNTKVIDAEGNYIMPGIIDDQVHFREPGLTHKANIFSESRAAVAGGITSILRCQIQYQIPLRLSYFMINLKLQKKILCKPHLCLGALMIILEILKINKKEVPAIKLFLGSSTEIC